MFDLKVPSLMSCSRSMHNGKNMVARNRIPNVNIFGSFISFTLEQFHNKLLKSDQK